ncbi:unnamed protein product, partial [Polarella glacialis]
VVAKASVAAREEEVEVARELAISLRRAAAPLATAAGSPTAMVALEVVAKASVAAREEEVEVARELAISLRRAAAPLATAASSPTAMVALEDFLSPSLVWGCHHLRRQCPQ